MSDRTQDIYGHPSFLSCRNHVTFGMKTISAYVELNTTKYQDIPRFLRMNHTYYICESNINSNENYFIKISCVF